MDSLSTRSTFGCRRSPLGSPWLALLAWCFATLAVAEVGPRTPLWSEPAPIGDGPDLGGNAFVTVHRPGHPNGTAVVICPGGGYGGLALEPEGTGIGRWLNDHGITGIVLEYRMPRGNRRVPLLDVQRALRWTRAQAASLGIEATRVGVLGFSAGGHLASTAATHFDEGNPAASDPMARLSSRPDFAILVYPVITMGDGGHAGSRQNLLGPQPSAEVIREFSNELQVTTRTPPCFMAHPRDDRVVPVENSRAFHRALRTAGVPSRYLELPRGDHGLNGYQGPMWDAWQTGALNWMAERQLIPQADVASRRTPGFRFPGYEELAAGIHAPRLLPGTGQFIFTLYGVPGEPDQVRELVDLMRDRSLGNGFDPGPGPASDGSNRALFDELAGNGWPVVFYSGGEMQIVGGRAVFGPPHEAALAGMDKAGVFCAYQLGEWGYYFHNLSHKESWWREVFGKDYAAYQHLKKPAGLAGYDRMPAGKREAYEVVREYYLSRSRDLLGRVISVTGHSHYESYAAEWGTRCVGLELGENIAFTQSKLAFARGAARQWGKPWSVQVSPWFGPAVTTSGELRTEGGIVRGLDAGHSLSFYERLWLHAWFAGAAMVTPENSMAIFFEKPEAPWTLTEHGHKAAEVFQFMNRHARGVPYTPVAIVLDRYAGYNGYMDKPWGILPPTAGDRELRDLFDHQLFPGANHIHTRADPENPEASYLRPTPYGELFDVLLSSVPPEVLPSYPVILLAGDLEFDTALLSELEKALRRGSRVLMSQRHRAALGAGFERLSGQGRVEILEPWVHPGTTRPAAIASPRLAQVVDEVSPVRVEGESVQYAINRTRGGWVVELIHNRGVIKRGDQATRIDASAVTRLTLTPRFDAKAARAWRAGTTFPEAGRVTLELGPGAVEYVEFEERRW